MNNVNSTRVQSTNDASTTSKCSAASKNYFKDNFIEHFVEKKKLRASLINLGYYARDVILSKLMKNFISFLKLQEISKFQIVLCGSGFDTSYWRFTEAKLLNNDSVFIEIDFPSVIKRKIELINRSEVLKSYTSDFTHEKSCHGINQLNHNYFLLEADLCDLNWIETLFNYIKINYNIPTLFLSECVITYMKEESSSQLIKWMAKRFKHSAFINYEQIHPDDGFGMVMLKHFEKLQSSLFSVDLYPDCASHALRYQTHGFAKCIAVSEWDALVSLTSKNERQTALGLELFDEFEEFHNKCVHYVVGVAGNQIASAWIDSLPFNHPSQRPKSDRRFSQLACVSRSLELYKHSSFAVNCRYIYLLGGSSKQRRSSAVLKIDINNNFNAEIVEVLSKQILLLVSEETESAMHYRCVFVKDGIAYYYNFDDNHFVQLDVLHGNLVYFELKGASFCCLYGGRTSPNSVCNNGAIVLFQILNNKFVTKSIIVGENLIPRYRSSMASLKSKENEIHLWIFGGRTANLYNSRSDLSRLIITLDEEKTVHHNWTTYERKSNENWPCGRISHSTVTCPKKFLLYMSCGLKANSSTVLNDLWKWCCRTETWHKLDLIGNLLPRYGHTSHLVDNALYLVGGVNTLAGSQPGVAKIDLDGLTVTEYSLKTEGLFATLLFNHTSEVIKNENGWQILILGGGGNCFSFGTHLNSGIHSISLCHLNEN